MSRFAAHPRAQSLAHSTRSSFVDWTKSWRSTIRPVKLQSVRNEPSATLRESSASRVMSRSITALSFTNRLSETTAFLIVSLGSLAIASSAGTACAGSNRMATRRAFSRTAGISSSLAATALRIVTAALSLIMDIVSIALIRTLRLGCRTPLARTAIDGAPTAAPEAHTALLVPSERPGLFAGREELLVEERFEDRSSDGQPQALPRAGLGFDLEFLERLRLAVDHFVQANQILLRAQPDHIVIAVILRPEDHAASLALTVLGRLDPH